MDKYILKQPESPGLTKIFSRSFISHESPLHLGQASTHQNELDGKI